MGFRSVKQYAEAWDKGRSFTGHFRKNYTATISDQFHDGTIFGGGPPAQYYASTPYEAAVLDGRKGIYHGEDKAPAAKFLTKFGISALSTNSRARYTLQDHLLYYPFIIGDDLTTQEMVNDVTLPRYTDGKGVMVMAICQSSSAGGGNFTMSYVNDQGVTKTTPTNFLHSNAMSVGNSVVGVGVGGTGISFPYITLADGDGGVRSINSITLGATHGGLFALVLVKPLTTLVVREGQTTSEVEMVTQAPGPQRIYDGAFLSYVAGPSPSPGGTALCGYIETIWDEGT
jgi:hypothetical protein